MKHFKSLKKSKLIKLTLIIIVGFFANSCYKIKAKNPIKVNISAENVFTHQGYQGVRYYLEELRDGKEIKRVYEGLTDANGKGSISYKRPINHKKWKYQVTILPPNDFFEYTFGNYVWEDIDNENENDITSLIGKKTQFNLHIKNTNCFDTNDKAIFKVEKGVYIHESYGSLTGFEFNGCTDETQSQTLTEDLYPYTLTVTRNGQTTTIKDTFEIKQGMDTLKWFY